MKEHAGMELVDEVLIEWERIVNKVAKVEVGEKMIFVVVELVDGGMKK